MEGAPAGAMLRGMSTAPVHTASELPENAIAEEGSNSLLFGLGAAMLVVVALACVLIEAPSMLSLLAALGGLVVMLGFVVLLIVRFIGEVDEH
jgi:hypothetical protein